MALLGLNDQAAEYLATLTESALAWGLQ